MTEIILNPLVSWKSLPWIKISQRIFILQEKVYKFSKQCDQHTVHKLQGHIINSSDIKLFIIEKIINNVNQYYCKYKKEKYKVKDIEKFCIYKNFFHIQKHKKSIKIILEYIKQYLVYVCIKPEWEARFEPMYKFKLNILNKSCFIYRTSKFLSNYSKNTQKVYNMSLYINKNTKYLFVSYFIKRIQSLPCIRYYINYWLSYQSINNSLNLKDLYYNFYPSIFNCLDMLIDYIMFNGLEWYLIYNVNFLKKISKVFKDIYILIDNNSYVKIYLNNFKFNIYLLNLIRTIYHNLNFYYLSFLYSYSINTNKD
uniref:hypothetical protein n=1 Tax=Hypnea wynnei TaxID=1867777 RepID=UPI0027DA3ED7|nr:hypothetical protein REP92_pgp124 [Hypnea wynnei]WCH56503.1 hypothetical protein [Hypnea wynnei]